MLGGDGRLLAVGGVSEFDGDVFVVATGRGITVGVVFDRFDNTAGVVEFGAVFFVGGVDRFVGFAVVVELGACDQNVVTSSRDR